MTENIQIPQKKTNKQTQKQHVNKKKHQYTPLLNKLR